MVIEVKTKLICTKCGKGRLKLYIHPIDEETFKFKYWCKKCKEWMDKSFFDMPK